MKTDVLYILAVCLYIWYAWWKLKVFLFVRILRTAQKFVELLLKVTTTTTKYNKGEMMIIQFFSRKNIGICIPPEKRVLMLDFRKSIETLQNLLYFWNKNLNNNN